MSLRLLGVSVASIYEPHRRSFDMMAHSCDWEVHLACPAAIQFVHGKPETPCAAPSKSARYTLHPLPHRFYHQQRMHWFVGLERLIARLRPDVVFAEYDPGSLPVLHARSFPGRQKIVAFTVENIQRNRWVDLGKNLRRRSLKGAARDAVVASLGSLGAAAVDGLACISPEGKRIFTSQGWTKPIEVVPLGTDVAAFAPGDEQELCEKLNLTGSFTVGYFGRLVPEKGVHILLEALLHTEPSVKLLLDMYENFAPGSYAAELMERVRALGLGQRVITVNVPHRDVPRYMRCCDLLILPSLTTERWKEQFGRVLPEAMACEVAVIGTRSGNIPEMIGDAGLLVPEGDPLALAGAIEALRLDPERRNMLGRAGRQRVVNHFSLEAQASALKRLVDAL